MSLFIFLCYRQQCVCEYMFAGQGHPVTREDMESDSVLHILPLVSCALLLPQLLFGL